MIATSPTKGTFDHNFEPDVARETKERTMAGIINVLDIMMGQNISWTLSTCDMLVEECLKSKDLQGFQFVLYIMDQANIDLKTTTFNMLMKRYAENGDSESAHELISVMKKSPHTVPNADTYSLMLDAGNKSRKGHFYSQELISQLIANNSMRKPDWDRFVELAILTGKSVVPIFASMVKAECQPDQNTLVLMFRALLRGGKVVEAMKWYRRLKQVNRSLNYAQEQLMTSKLSDSKNDKKVDLVIEAKTGSDQVDMYLPYPGQRVVVMLLEVLRDKGLYEDAIYILDGLNERQILNFGLMEKRLVVEQHNISFSKSSKKVKVMGTGREKIVYVTALSKQAEVEARKQAAPIASDTTLLSSHFKADENIYSLVMEACIIANKPECGLKIFLDMEKHGLRANRRIYSLLIRIFGQLEDVNSALGVFDEMKNSLQPDVETLQRVLEVCMRDPMDLRQAAAILESMAEDGVDLNLYSKDILMEAFPDGVSLSKALFLMQSQPMLPEVQVIRVSLSVASCLVQAARKGKTVSAIVDALKFLGKVGIRLDSVTMEYFTIPDVLEDNSRTSKHYFEKLIPHKEKVRSLMSIDMPVAYDTTFDVENRFYLSEEGRILGVLEPYFESGNDSYRDFSRMMKQGIFEDDTSYDDNDDVFDETSDAKCDVSTGTHSVQKSTEVAPMAYIDTISKILSVEKGNYGRNVVDSVLRRPASVSKNKKGEKMTRKGIRSKNGRKKMFTINAEAADDDATSKKLIPMGTLSSTKKVRKRHNPQKVKKDK